MTKFENMTKDQKQKVVLIGIVAMAAIFALKQFVLAPLIASRGSARADYEALMAKLDLANKAIMDETVTARMLEESQRILKLDSRDRIPSPDNLLAWATKSIYGNARAVGVDVESVAETDMDVSGFIAKDQTRLSFKPYGVRISVQCSFAKLVQFVTALETTNPYLCVSSIQVSAQPNSPDLHMATIVVEWPSWKDPARANAFTEMETKGKNA